MTRKFFFCFPLRAGNIFLGYILMILSIAVAAYSIFEMGINIIDGKEYALEGRFSHWGNIDTIMYDKFTIITAITTFYYATYIVVALSMFIFSIIYVIGSHQANHCLVTTFFVYSFLYLFMTVFLIIWEATSSGYIQIGIILLSDVLLIICLFSVKYLMEAIRTGNVYSRPGVVYNYY